MNNIADLPIINRYQALLDLMGGLDPDKAQLALAIYRGIVDRDSAEPAALAELTGLTVDAINRHLEESAGVFRDEHGNVTGFWGLTAAAISPHKFIVGPKTLHAWCAWDTLFLPELLGRTAHIESECAQTRTPIKLQVSPTEIIAVSHPEMMLSMLVPEAEAFSRDLLGSFCHHVHFFRDAVAGSAWLAEAYALGV